MGTPSSKNPRNMDHSSPEEANMVFYHYTSTTHAKQIKRRGLIVKGEPGTILNKMPPEQYFRDEILQNNYGQNMNRRFENRADYVILCRNLDYRHLEEVKLDDRHYFYYHDDIPISESQVFNKPRCQRSSDTHKFKDEPKEQVGERVIINLRKDQSIEDTKNQLYQSGNTTIFAPRWVRQGLESLQNSIKFPLRCKKIDEYGEEKTYEIHNLSLKTLQQISRNEKWNTNGIINFDLFGEIERTVVLSLKDLVRQTVIIGIDETTHYGGLRNSPRITQKAQVYICDLIALQFQQNYNTGRLVIIGQNLPKGQLDDFIYESITGESRPSYEAAREDTTGRFIKFTDVFFDKKAYVKFVSRDFLLACLALDSVAKEKITFKFIKYGCGYYAGQFSTTITHLISKGVSDGMREALRKVKNISRIELIFFDRDEEVEELCKAHGVEVVFSNDDPLKKTHDDLGMATTNCADNHACIGNAMGFKSVDGAIAENLSLRGFNLSPNINQCMREVYIEAVSLSNY